MNLALPTSDVDFVIGAADVPMVSTLENASTEPSDNSTAGMTATMQPRPMPSTKIPQLSRDGTDGAHALSCLHRLRDRLLEKFGESIQWSLVIDAKVRFCWQFFCLSRATEAATM